LVDLDQGNIVESVEEGPVVEADCLQGVLARLEEYLPQAELLILSGSLPPGFPNSGLADMLELANRHHVKTVADLHGQDLLQILGHAPWLIKPSLAEFDELIGAATASIHERARACQQLFRDTGVIVALSMSGEGLLVTCAEGQWRLNPPRAHVHLPEGRGRNVIGCGDALVGALAYEYSQTGDLLAAARLGLSAAHCNLGTFGVPEIDAGVTRRLAGAIELEAVWADGSQK
jgi:fructose-1-phosphate kinase PfkB-like protein